MARIAPLRRDDADPQVRATIDSIEASYGFATNMKRTLARSPVALRALMQWYDLRDEVRNFLGDRLTTLFAHAVSLTSDCIVCTTYFRRSLIEAGEDPDATVFNERELMVIEYGKQLAKEPNNVSDALYQRLASRFSAEEIVTLTAFGGLMVATNVFNNALGIELDREMHGYRKGFPE